MAYKILIVEDDPSIQKHLQTLLAANGYEASCITDFCNLQDQVRAFGPHLVLMDISLPETTALRFAPKSVRTVRYRLFL